MSEAIVVRPLTPQRWDDLVELLSASNGCDGCWCFNHHIDPGAPDVRGPAALAAKHDVVRRGKAHGVIGYRDDAPIGWCAVDRRAEIPGHDCVRSRPTHASAKSASDSPPTDDRTWVIHCFFVKPGQRGQGVARAMLCSVLDWLAREQAHRVEAFPTPPGRPACFHGYAGPYELYRAFGFQQIESIDDNYCRVVLTLQPLA